jgi:hypothetical protein
MRKSRASMWRRYLLFFTSIGFTWAQGALSGPSVGFFFDPRALALRRIWGIPGSAIPGANLDLGFSVTKAIFSPLQDYALVTAEEGSVSLALLGQTGITTESITSLPPAPDRIVVSPAGHAAAFAYGTSIKILTGLPGSLDRLEEIDVSALPAAPNALAVSDDGGVLLVSVPDNTDTSSAGGVFVFSRGESGPRLIAGQMASDLNFFAESHDALMTNENSNSVTALQDVDNAAAAKWIFTDDRLSAPSVARTSLDGKRIVVGSANNSVVALLDRDGGNATFLACGCSPNRTSPLSNSVYQLTDPGNGLLWILDLSQEPRLFFVPVPDASGDPQ